MDKHEKGIMMFDKQSGECLPVRVIDRISRCGQGPTNRGLSASYSSCYSYQH